MSYKKLGGLDRKLSSKRFNVKTGSENFDKMVAVGRGVAGDYSARNTTDMRAGDSGTRTVADEEQRVAEGAARTEQERLQAITDEASRKQAEIDAQNAQDEEARKKLREAQGGGYAANVLAGGKGFGYGGGALRRLSGS